MNHNWLKLSIDITVDEIESVNFPIKLLNSIKILGIPPKNLRLKIGFPIILQRNLIIKKIKKKKKKGLVATYSNDTVKFYSTL